MKPETGTELYFDSKPLGKVIKLDPYFDGTEDIISFKYPNGDDSCIIWKHADGSLNPRLDWNTKYD